MKKLFLFICGFIFSGLSFSQILIKLSNDSAIAYSYSGGDEFNQDQLDENYWHNGLGWTRVLMSQDLAFSPKHVKLSKGLVRFIAEKKDSVYVLGAHEIDSALLKKTKMNFEGNRFLTKYSVGCIITKQKLHYGIYELRFKVEEGKGIWPAFWFFGGYKNEEIDAFELKGERKNQIHVDAHCPKGCDNGYKGKLNLAANWGGWLSVSDYLHNGFNIMHLEWDKDQVIWYMNGYPLAYFKGAFPNPMNLYLNTSVAKDGGAFKPGPDTTNIWPNTYSVDYMRIWQNTEPSQQLVLKPNDALITSDEFISTYTTKPIKKGGITYKKKEFRALNGLIYLALNSKNQLTVRVNGKLSENKVSLHLKGKILDQTLSDLSKEVLIELPASETSLVLTIRDKGHSFQKQITLQR